MKPMTSKFLILALISVPALLACSEDASLGNNSDGVQSGDDDDATSAGESSVSASTEADGTEPSEHEPEDEPGSTAVAEPTDAPSGVAETTEEPSHESSEVDSTSVSGEDDPTSVSSEETGEGGAAVVPTMTGAGGSSPAPDDSNSQPTDSCENIQCIRAIECVETCGGPVLQASCCPCEEGTFDSIECNVGMGGASSGGASSGGASSGGTHSGGTSSGGAHSGGATTGGASAGGAGGASYDPELLNTECVEDTCSEGLTPVHFYGIAGTSGPEFCWCTIPCADDPEVCTGDATCTTIADGPGEVCYVHEN